MSVDSISKTLILKLHHASLIVKNIDVALMFYQDILGLELDHSRPNLGYPGAWLILPEQQQIHLMELPNPDSNSVRPQHGGRDLLAREEQVSVRVLALEQQACGGAEDRRRRALLGEQSQRLA